MGKIIGIALVGLTQFALWVVLTFGIVSIASSFITTKPAAIEQTDFKRGHVATEKTEPLTGKEARIANLLDSVSSINFPVILGIFLFYFIGGYLLYAALFAAVGSAVDSETDTQQFMLPITIPLILSFVVAQTIMANPEGAVGFWFSIIPFTSPVVMMVRIPFGVPYHHLALSATLLVLGFLFTTWIAGRIYRTGILMYGKKVNYKELAKWLFYKG